MRQFALNSIEMSRMKRNGLSPVIPERSNWGTQTQFRTDNQPKRRGRPAGSGNRISPAMRKMILEVMEELGRVDYDDWEKLPCGDGVKGSLKLMAIRNPKSFMRLVGRCLPAPRRASPDDRSWQEQ
jgi:hypothetical protein